MTKSDIIYVVVIIVIGFIMIAAILGVVSIVLFSENDNTVLIGLILAAAAPTITGLLSLAKSIQNSNDLADTKERVTNLAVTVDGRLSQLLEAKTEAAHSAGVLTGTQDERDRNALLPAVV